MYDVRRTAIHDLGHRCAVVHLNRVQQSATGAVRSIRFHVTNYQRSSWIPLIFISKHETAQVSDGRHSRSDHRSGMTSACDISGVLSSSSPHVAAGYLSDRDIWAVCRRRRRNASSCYVIRRHDIKSRLRSRTCRASFLKASLCLASFLVFSCWCM